ncbi:MAG: alanine dehydrogenase [Planctomycetota bacterium]|jgi:alanine dehydrogenase|nr:alanine dehydrogenase [Planctomycetota bacterium]
MKIGCVKEIKRYEYRVGITPDNAREYRAHGHEVLVEAGLGDGSSFTDAMYREAGAAVLDDAAAVWAGSEMMVKVKEPLASECALMRDGQIIYAYLHLAANRPLTEALLDRRVRAVAYETVRDGKGGLPLLKPMSEVAGRLSVQEGAKCLEIPMGGRGVLLGGVPGTPRAKVVVIGGGVVGANACRMAAGLGARVVVMDNNPGRLEALDELFGNAVQTIFSTPAAIEREIADADLIIGAVLVPGAAAPKLIKKSHLSGMRKGSVIVDVAVDQGGCCETTRPTSHDDPTFAVDGVLHYCVANMPGAVPVTSTVALTNSTLGPGLELADKGFERAVKENRFLAPGVNCYLGRLICREVARGFGLEYGDLAELLS